MLTYSQVLDSKVGVQQLREGIPAHCFKSSYRTSLYYLFRDLALASTLAYAALRFLPKVPNFPLRYISWAVYGYLQGLVLTGVWVWFTS